MQSHATTCFVDWLSVTYTADMLPGLRIRDGDTAVLDLNNLAQQAGAPTRATPHYGYTKAVKWRSGVTAYISPGSDRQGLHIQYPGSSLDPNTVANLCSWHYGHNARATRIDLAMDCKLDFDMEQAYRDLQSGIAITRSKVYTMLSGSRGSTLYVGARTSERMLRIYDKAAQMLQPGSKPWYRVELECKGDFARNALGAIVLHGTKAIPSIIKAFCDWPTLSAWQTIMDGEKSLKLKPSDRREKETWRWLRDQVAPALANYAHQNGEAETLIAFLSSFAKELTKLRQLDTLS